MERKTPTQAKTYLIACGVAQLVREEVRTNEL